MRFILIVIAILFALDGIGWGVLARLTRRSKWRYLLVSFMIAQLAGLAWLLFGRFSGLGWDRFMPKFVITSVFIWHCLGLPLLLGLTLVALPFLAIKVALQFSRGRSRFPSTPIGDSPEWNRRQFLAFAAAAAPPLFTLSLATAALPARP